MNSGTHEIEVKLPIDNPGEMRKRLLSLGFLISVERSFEDNHVYDLPDGSLRRRGCLFRVRDFNGRTVITYKGPAALLSQFKIREEIEAIVSPASNFHKILDGLGMRMGFHYQKYRTIFHGNCIGPVEEVVQLMLDETPIGNFLEIEGAKSAIEQVSATLGFSAADFISESYLSLYLKRFPGGENFQMVFK
jgi:adenylate cyclase class 2